MCQMPKSMAEINHGILLLSKTGTMKSSGSILLSDTGNVHSNYSQHRITIRSNSAGRLFFTLIFRTNGNKKSYKKQISWKSELSLIANFIYVCT